jgi:regulatory protein
MGKITALEPQRRSGRVNVFIDGEFALGLHASVADDQGLRVGLDITADELLAVSKDEERRRAVANAVRMLESRSRSRQEIESRLQERAYSSEVIEAVIAQLTRAGLVDDTAFAKEWVGTRSKAREPVGRIRLKHELKLKGIAQDLADNAIGDVDEAEELAQAIRAAQRHARPYAGYAGWMAERQRLAGYLQRRGYNWDITHAVLKTVVAECRDSEPDMDEADLPL